MLNKTYLLLKSLKAFEVLFIFHLIVKALVQGFENFTYL